MIKDSYSIILFSAVLLFSCCNDRNKNKQTSLDQFEITEITLNNDYETLAESVIANIEFVQLGSFEDVMIGEVSNVRVTDDYLVIADVSQSKSVFIYNRQGDPVVTINRVGHGPQEYINMAHVTLTADKKNVAVYDNYGGKVLFYNFQGEFTKSIPVDFFFSSMEYLDDNTILCVTYGVQKENSDVSVLKENDLVIFTDGDFKIKSGVLPCIYNRDLFTSVTPHLNKFQHTVCVNPAYCDTIYVAGRDALTARYRLDLGEIDGASNFAADMTDQKLETLEESRALFSGSYVDGEDFFLVSVSLPPDRVVVDYIYAKATEKVYRLKSDLTRPDYFIGMNLGRSSTCYKDQFVAAIPAYQIVTSLSEEVRSGIPALKDLTEESNPVIAFYMLKEPDTK